MKRSILLAYGISLLLLAILVGMYLAQPNPLARRVRELERELIQAQTDLSSLKASASLTATTSPTSVTNNAATTISASASGRNLNPVTQRTTPSYRDVQPMTESQQSAFDSQHADLFKHLHLSPEEKNYFQHLLLTRQAKLHELFIRSPGSGSTPEQIAAQNLAYDATKQEADAVIKHFLNNDKDFQTYQQWQETGFERLFMKFAVTDFDDAGETLSRDQRNQLFDLLIAKRITPADRAQVKKSIKTNSATLSAPFQPLIADRNKAILQQANAFLAPSQITLLEKVQQKFYPKPPPAATP